MIRHCASQPPAGGSAIEQGAPAAFTTAADVSAFSISPAAFLASRPDVHNLIAGAMVFRPAPGGSGSSSSRFETLLLQRAPTDSFALRWEIPAGTADPAVDRSIAGVAVRELWEETQLRARRLVRAVGLGLAEGATHLALTGDAEEARMDAEWDLCLLRVVGQTWAVATFLADVEDVHAEVVLRPDEHVSWAWVDEEEVKNQQFRDRGTGKGTSLDFVSEAMKAVVLEGFRLWKEMATEEDEDGTSGEAMQF